ncbi:MAG: lysozyme inhibitor LprI family protein [Campylobacteraceae bacterium]|jgi:uncharacterized protein|nr:lysozyme inhibitor LprI family protein [Campylobacteraceae bacterium]
MKKILLFLTLTLTLTFLFPASFDCKKAKTDVEKLICSNEELSRLDEELNEAYKKLLAMTNNDDKKMIIQEQREWVKYRDGAIDIIDVQYAYFDRLHNTRYYLRTLTDRELSVRGNTIAQKTERYPTYAEVLEDKNITFPKSTRQDLFSKVRPANNFQLIGGTKNPICKETIALFNEEGTYQLDTNWYAEGRSSPKGENNDRFFWYLNNSGLVLWEEIENESERNFDFDGKSQTFHFGLDYKEIDMNSDGINEHIYRTGNMVSSQYLQKIYIYNQNIHNNNKLLEKYKEPCERIYGQGKCDSNTSLTYQVIRSNYNDEWKSTQDIDAAMRHIVYDQKSLDILYPNNSIKIARNTIVGENNMAEYTAQWNLYKIKSGMVLILIPWMQEWKQAPEFLVFSLHKNKLATLECVIIPKEWQ